MSDIPPPLTPKPDGHQDKIMIPWSIADAPRLQLEFLSRSVVLNQSSRAAVATWLDAYNNFVVKWIRANYGEEAVIAADIMSRTTAARMNENKAAADDKAARDLFKKLEDEFKNE